MAAIPQTAYKNASFNTLRPIQNGRHFTDDTFKRNSWTQMLEFRLKFHWSLFQRVQLTTFQHWFRYLIGANQATGHYLSQWWLVYWCLYASLGLNDLMKDCFILSQISLTLFFIVHLTYIIIGAGYGQTSNNDRASYNPTPKFCDDIWRH